MANPIITKLYKQAVERVSKELEAERNIRVKKYVATAIRVLVKQGIIDSADAKAAASQYGIRPSDALPRPAPAPYSNPCGGQSNNIC